MSEIALFSQRFGKAIVLTDHARARMVHRGMDERLLLDLVETGEVRMKDAARGWIAKYYAERDDNLVCVAVVLETVLVIKTVLHHFTWEL